MAEDDARLLYETIDLLSQSLGAVEAEIERAREQVRKPESLLCQCRNRILFLSQLVDRANVVTTVKLHGGKDNGPAGDGE